MGHPTLEKLTRDRERLVALVETLSEEELAKSVDDSWTVRDTLTHLANAEEDHCKVIAVAVRGDPERLPQQLDLNDHNARRLQERGVLGRGELLAAMAAQRERTEALFARVKDEHLELPVRHPALGETTVGKIFRIIGIHEKMHLKEIEEALAR